MTTRRQSRRKFLQTLCATPASLGAAFVAGPLMRGCSPFRRAAEISLAASPEAVSDAQIERFNRQFAPYHAVRVALPADALAESLAGPHAPDVIALPAVSAARLGQLGALRNLAGEFQASALAQGAELFEVDNYFTSGEQRWGLALVWSPDYLVWANTKLWQAAGVVLPEGAVSLEDWRELSARLSILQRDGQLVNGTNFTFDFSALLWLAETLDPPARLYRAGGHELDLLSRPDYVETVRFVLEWKRAGGIPYRSAFDPLQQHSDCFT